MKQKDLTEFIIDEFARGQDRDEIVRQVRENYDMNPREAEIFVLRVETDHDQDISIRQGPVLFGFSLIAFVGGLILVLGSIWTIAVPLVASISSANTTPAASDAFYQAGLQFLIGMGFLFAGGRWLRNSKILNDLLKRKL